VGQGRKGAGLPYLYLLSISARSANVTPPSLSARAIRAVSKSDRAGGTGRAAYAIFSWSSVFRRAPAQFDSSPCAPYNPIADLPGVNPS